MRRTYSFSICDINLARVNLINWAKQFDNSIMLDSNADRLLKTGEMSFSDYDILAGLGHLSFTTVEKDAFHDIKYFAESNSDWCFGHLGYDLKSSTHLSPSENIDFIGFQDYFFFIPKWVVAIKGKKVSVFYPDDIDETELKKIEILLSEKQSIVIQATVTNEAFKFINNDDYIRKVIALKKHIHRGDIYEINYCISFLLQNIKIDPYFLFLIQNEKSPAPFAAFYKNKDKFLLSSSPERFIKKSGNKIISQPIKGTISRGKTREEDNLLKLNLLDSEKERSENIMITDLVRNDLSITAQYGSIKVDELCGLYSFKHVHQLISTVSSVLDDNYQWIDAIKHAFPMGSMTGAPKYNAIKLAEQYENFKRGLYSGSVGYITPNQDFDFNVVIRSILYDNSTGNLCIPAGSAITAQSDPEKECEECILKAQALMDLVDKNS